MFVFLLQICSRDEATLRKRSLSLSQRGRNKRGIFSSLKGLDNLTRRGREKRPSASQVHLAVVCYHYNCFTVSVWAKISAVGFEGVKIQPKDLEEWGRGGDGGSV